VTAPLVLSEVFGPTVQGEGPSMGRRCMFVRLGGCNLSCRWCDTPYTWDWRGLTGTAYDPKKELHRTDVADVARAVVEADVTLLVVSGGEPLLQQRGLADLFAVLPAGLDIEIETNGTRAPTPEITDAVTHFNVSPKLMHSGDPLRRRIIAAGLVGLRDSGKAVWKFVASRPADLSEIKVIVDSLGLYPVYVMPLGTDRESTGARLSEMAEAIIANGWNITTRLHVDIWGERRGV